MEKKAGRPKTAEYRKIRHRYSKIEDTLIPVIEKFQNPEDKKMILKALEQLKA